MVLYELLYGAGRSSDLVHTRREVEHFAARLAVLPFDSEVAACTANIRADLERNGRIKSPYDLMNGGHARSREIVVTGNLWEFYRMDGLRTED